MPYAAEHLLFTTSGLTASGETWSCGLRTRGFITSGLDDKAEQVAERWATLIATPGATFGVGTTVTNVTARRINPSGVTIEQAEASPNAPASGSGGPILPPQCSVVVTLLTDRPGRTGKGRIYLPALGSAASTIGRIGATQRTAILNGMAALITGINSDLAGGSSGDTARIAVQSQAALVASDVVAVRVGDVFDTQRRRRADLVENYAVAAVVVPNP